jgi:hypothetical protein
MLIMQNLRWRERQLRWNVTAITSVLYGSGTYNFVTQDYENI